MKPGLPTSVKNDQTLDLTLTKMLQANKPNSFCVCTNILDLP